jgi:hypothetical protein
MCKHKDAKPVGHPIPNQPLPPPDTEGESYRTAVGQLQYLASWTRPDLAFATSILGSFNHCHGDEHWKLVKNVLRYLKGTQTHGLLFPSSPNSTNILYGYSDADWGGDSDSFSRSGRVIMSFDSAVHWKSCKQTVVAKSTTVSEFISASDAAIDLLGIKRLLEELEMAPLDPIILHEDNQPCIQLTNSATANKRIRHLEIPAQALRNMVKEKLIRLVYTPTTEMAADALTKAVGSTAMARFRKIIGVGTPIAI